MKFWIAASQLKPESECYIFREDGVEVKVTFSRKNKWVRFITHRRKYQLTMLEKIEIHKYYHMTEKIELE